MNQIIQTIEAIDFILKDFVFSLFNNITGNADNLIRLLLVLFIISWAIKCFHGGQNFFPVLWKVLVFLTMVEMGTNWEHYGYWVYDTFVEGTKAMALVVNNGNPVIEDFFIMLWHALRISVELFLQSDFLSALAVFIIAFFYFVAGLVLGAVGAFMLLVSKIMLGVMLGIGPIFISFILFDSTRNMFNSWLASTIKFSLLFVIVTVIMTMVVRLIFPLIKEFTIAIASGEDITGKSTNFYSHIILMFASAGMLVYASPLSSQLSDGVRMHVGSSYHAVENSLRRGGRIAQGIASYLPRSSGPYGTIRQP